MNLTKEIISRTDRYGFYSNNMLLPNPDNIVGTKGGYQTLRKLRQDPHVSSCIQSRRSGLLAMDWTIKNKKASKTVINAVNEMLENIDIQQLMRDSLEAVLYGFQAIEIIWDKLGDYIMPIDLLAKPQEWFVFDNSGKLRYCTSKNNEGELLPKNKVLTARYEPTYINPYGSALLSKCYWSVTFKNASLRFWVNFMERFGMPLLLGQYNRGVSQDEAKNLAEALNDMSEDSVIVAPSDITIDIKEPMRFSSNTMYQDLIKLCNDEISKALLSETLTTEMGGGTYAAAKVHSDIRKEVILSDKRIVEKVVNELIRYFIDINFKGENVPKFEIIVAFSDLKDILQRDEMLARACHIKYSTDYLSRQYGFEKGDLLE